jgi:hypothetical protein
MLHPLDKLKIEYIFNTFSIVSIGSFVMIIALIFFLVFILILDFSSFSFV